MQIIFIILYANTFCKLQALSQLTNYLGHFPFNTGAVRPQSQVTENEDDTSGEDDLTPAIFDKDNLQVFIFGRIPTISLITVLCILLQMKTIFISEKRRQGE